MNKEENIITEFIQHSNDFTITNSDLTTRKIVVNNIEITSIEDWNKVTKSLIELQQENQQLKEQKKELRSWLEYKLASDNYNDGMYYAFKICLSKLNELEESK